jgi:hypothetical protein
MQIWAENIVKNDFRALIFILPIKYIGLTKRGSKFISEILITPEKNS